MTNFTETTLGRTGLKVGRLGMAASYGAPSRAFEEAFDHGCNYFYLGSGRKREQMRQAVRGLVRRGKRDSLVVALQTYARFGLLTETLFNRALRSMGLDHADVMILGWHNRPPSSRLIDTALAMKEKGLCRHLGVSGHNRTLFPKLRESGIFDVFHIRYNAAHRGAEAEAFPYLGGEDRPGVVSYTATRWGHLLDPAKMPPGTPPPDAATCYRFALSNPSVDVCLCGPRTIEQMRQALPALELGPLSAEEMTAMKRIGDHVRQTAKGFFG